MDRKGDENVLIEIDASVEEWEVKTKDLAKLFNVSVRRIQQLTQDGILETNENGKYNLSEALESYITQRSKTDNAEDAKIRRDRSKAETSIKASKAIIANLEANELKGKMFRVEDIKAITEDYFYEIRNMINALPGQLAVDVAASDNAAECAVIIRTCINRLLMNMQKYRFDVNKYRERVHERMSWDTKEDSDGGEE